MPVASDFPAALAEHAASLDAYDQAAAASQQAGAAWVDAYKLAVPGLGQGDPEPVLAELRRLHHAETRARRAELRAIIRLARAARELDRAQKTHEAARN